MRKSRLLKSKQTKLIEYFIAGATARCAANLVGVNKSTAAYYFKRLREIISEQLKKEQSHLFADKKTTSMGLRIFGINPKGIFVHLMVLLKTHLNYS